MTSDYRSIMADSSIGRLGMMEATISGYVSPSDTLRDLASHCLTIQSNALLNAVSDGCVIDKIACDFAREFKCIADRLKVNGVEVPQEVIYLGDATHLLECMTASLECIKSCINTLDELDKHVVAKMGVCLEHHMYCLSEYLASETTDPAY